MNDPHDLGGRLGFGPVPVHADQPWTTWWEQAAGPLAAMTANVVGVNRDALRYVMECLDEDDYRRLGPAGRWLEVAVRCAVGAGVATREELDDRARRRAAGLPPRPVEEYLGPQRTVSHVPRRIPHNKRQPGWETEDPRFVPGQWVRTRAERPVGHTRLPGYLRHRRGEVVGVNGYWVLPDSNAHGRPEEPTWVYTIRFSAAELWPGAEPHEVYGDVFEPYLLEAVPDARAD
jgi:nitrile hydratase subunit beta